MVGKLKSTGRITVVGIGNPSRGDDAIGLLVAHWLRERGIDGVEIIPWPGDTLSLFEKIKDSNVVILIDAVSPRGKPGGIYKFNLKDDSVWPELSAYSTHSFGIFHLVELLRVMDSLPQELMIYGIEGKNFGIGDDMSNVVIESARKVVEEIEVIVRGGLPSTNQ